MASINLFALLLSLTLCLTQIILTESEETESGEEENVDSPVSYNASVDHVTLRLVTVLFNEGLSTPPSGFSYVDPYLRPEFWPDGMSQLTGEGKRQLFELGKRFRSRYRDFLTDSPREVYARSRDRDNNIEAALVFLHGAYKAKGDWKYGNTDYLPIAVHTVPESDDCALSVDCECPKIPQVISDLLSTPEAEAMKKEFAETIKLIESKTRISSFWRQIDYVETVLQQSMLRSKLPSWVTPGVIDDFTDLANSFHSMATAEPQMLKQMVGSLYSELIHRLQNISTSYTRVTARQQPQKPRLLLYSSITPILASVVYDLTGLNGVIPPPGSFAILELFEEPGSSFFVKMYYWNHTDARSPNVLYPNLTQPSEASSSPVMSVPLNDLIAHMQSFTEPDWAVYCGLGSAGSSLDTLSVALIIILCLIFGIIGITIFMIVKRSRSGYVIFK